MSEQITGYSVGNTETGENLGGGDYPPNVRVMTPEESARATVEGRLPPRRVVGADCGHPMNAFWMFLNAAFCAFDVAVFSATGNPLSIAAAVLCGFIALALLLQDVTR